MKTRNRAAGLGLSGSSSSVFLFCKIYNEKFVGYCVFRNNHFYSLKIYNQSIKSNPYYLIQLSFCTLATIVLGTLVMLLTTPLG